MTISLTKRDDYGLSCEDWIGTAVDLRRACVLARQAAFAGNEGGRRLLVLIEGCTPEIGAPIGRLKYGNKISE